MRMVSIPFKRESVSQVWISCCRWTLQKFQFPSNGKAYHKLKMKWTLKQRSACFNSLQTGKRITSYPVAVPKTNAIAMFQFPSNGKAYHKANRQETLLRANRKVSIPFKRERVSQVGATTPCNQVHFEVSIPFKRESVSQEATTRTLSVVCTVSIPFKRESVSQDIENTPLNLCIRGFNSLQTGKRITSHSNLHTRNHQRRSVSIPFKRESVSQDMRVGM